jgi:hypothetical protein
MGRTYRKNDRWKKDQKDQNFRNSKKFKDFKKNKIQPKPNLPVIDSESKDIDDNNDVNI